MRAGLLRSKLEFQHPATGTIANNGQVLDTPWTTYYTCWGFVQPVSVDEAVQQDQLTASRYYTISIRYVAGIKPEDRILFDGMTLQIKGVENVDSRKREYKITGVMIDN